ncbi:hypothetical protein Rctr197k_042 [Virus Rctr197k]|nr:hypothetical protein Rctr197k_042 [Virus Rctr197k]
MHRDRGHTTAELRLPRVRVDLGGRATTACLVACTAEEQARGLQGLSLRAGEGMLFPFHPPRAATFHMGKVAYPIDLVFADGGGRVGRIVHAAQPGSRETWSAPIVGAVVELPGGFAQQVGLSVGDRLTVAGRRLGAQTYNLLRTLTEASSVDEPRGPQENGFEVRGDPPPLMDGYYSKEPQHAPPDYGGAHNYVNEEDRWQDRDPFSDPNRMEQPNEHFEWDMGYSRPNDDDGTPIGPSVRMGTRPKGHQDRLTLPVRVGQVVYMTLADGTPVPYRIVSSEPKDLISGGGMGLRTHVKVQPADKPYDEGGWYPVDALWARPPRIAQRLEVSLPQFLPAMAEAAARAGLPYEGLALNERRERAIVTPQEVGRWLHTLGLPERDRDRVFDAATSEPGLDRIGAALIAAGLAETANLTHYGAQNVLVLTRHKRGSLWT